MANGLLLMIRKIKCIKKLGPLNNNPSLITLWGEIWESNPCIIEPQSTVLTTSPIPP